MSKRYSQIAGFRLTTQDRYAKVLDFQNLTRILDRAYAAFETDARNVEKSWDELTGELIINFHYRARTKVDVSPFRVVSFSYKPTPPGGWCHVRDVPAGINAALVTVELRNPATYTDFELDNGTKPVHTSRTPDGWRGGE